MPKPSSNAQEEPSAAQNVAGRRVKSVSAKNLVYIVMPLPCRNRRQSVFASSSENPSECKQYSRQRPSISAINQPGGIDTPNDIFAGSSLISDILIYDEDQYIMAGDPAGKLYSLATW
jgi:hypothetical protein